MILLHRPLIPRPRMGHTYVGNNHHKKATEHANLLVDLLAQFEAGEKIDTVRALITYFFIRSDIDDNPPAPICLSVSYRRMMRM